MELKTPLYDCHVAAKGKIVPFAGYLLPVQYTDVIEEHLAVRNAAGLFDVSHMGEVMLKGPDALENLNFILTNNFTEMPIGRCRYSIICNEKGGVVDDVIVYKIDDETFLIVVNAANRHKDVAHLKANIFGDVTLEDISDSISQIALQGPKSWDIIRKLIKEEDIPQKYYTFKRNVNINGADCIISQTGYTGETGFEIYLNNDAAPALWNKLLEVGAEFGLIPCGLGARDTLRLEAAMPLYGHEMDDEITPFEAGLNFGVKMDKPNFIGKEALAESLPAGRCRVGLKATGRGIIREHQDVMIGDKQIGHTTSGTFCPKLNGAYAMALIDKNFNEISTKVNVLVRGRTVEAEIVPLPFYKHP